MVQSYFSGRKRVLPLVGRTIVPSQRAGRGICWLHDQTSGRALPRCRSGGIARRPPVHSRSTLKSSSSRTQQRHLEYLATSLQTLANNDWGSHRGSSSSDNEEEPGRGLVKRPKTAAEVQEAHPQGMALEKQQWRRCWRCCWRRRHRFPDTRDIWSVSNKGPTTRDANCERTTRWTPPW